MGRIAFHFGAPDKLGYACRLLRKAVRSGTRVLVWVPEPWIPRLNDALWGVSATDFLTHCDESSADSVQRRSAVLLSTTGRTGDGSYGALVNLTDEMPDNFEDFPRVIEVVSLDDDDRQHARRRWKRYTELGFAIDRHDLKLKGEA